jgi:deoxyribodipyrimidine photo-lyase
MHGTVGGKFEPTRESGWKQLEAFLPRARVYEERRGYVEPPDHANVSRLSPWLQKRLVLEEEVVAAARAWWGFARVEKLIQETHWRTYWKGWLEHHPEVWDRWAEAAPRRRDELRGELRSAHEAALAGATDIACFNAWARELRETGWLHNHARMWFASIWVHTLRLPWELGVAFFQEHLLDGDAASNTLSWRWVAGLHTPGKTYLARRDNIARYAGAELAPPEGRLAEAPLVLSEPPPTRRELPARPTSWRETELGEGGGGGRVGLWLHPEDLCAEVGGLADAPVAAIFAGWPRELGRRAGWSAGVEIWTRAALEDGAERAGRRFACGVERGAKETLAAALVEWARRERLDAVLVHEPMQGPWRAEALAAERALAAAGVSLLWIRRKWDDRLWPLATRVFFPFWEAVKREHGKA